MSTQDLLIEIGTEELPPKALSFLSHALEELIKNSLKSAGLHSKSVKRFATPRRLALLVTELDVAQKDKSTPSRCTRDTSQLQAVHQHGLLHGLHGATWQGRALRPHLSSERAEDRA